MFLRFFYLFGVLIGLSSTAIAQKDEKGKSIHEVLQNIEKKSDWVFNYDPQKLGAYTFDGPLPKGDISNQLTQLFYYTPYTFEINEKSILIFLEAPTTYRLCGTIRDRTDRRSLPLANIFMDSQQQGTQADENGDFEVEFTAHKHQVVTISYIGYQSQSFVMQELNQEACRDFFLEIDPALFGEAIIVKDYILPEVTEGEIYSGVHIDYQKLAKRQTIIEQDILKTVQLIPGVNSTDESATNLQIRGSTPDQNLVLWEGVTLYDPGHLFGMLSAVNPYIIEEVQVFKGAFDSRYDNRVGGIVDMSLGDTIVAQFHGGVGSTLTEAHAYFELPIISNKLSLLLSGRHSINNILNSPTLQNYSTKVFQGSKVADQQGEAEGEDLEVEQLLDFYDWNGKLIFRPNSQWTFRGSWLQTQNTFAYQAALFDDERFTVDNVLFDSRAINLTAIFQPKKDWQLSLAYLSSTYSNDYFFALINPESDETLLNTTIFNDIKDQGVVLQTNYQINPTLNLQLGYDYNQKAVNFNAEEVSVYEDGFADFNFSEGHFHNIFGSLNYQQLNLQLNGGLRATYFVEANNLALSPRLSMRYALSEHWRLKISGGIFQQYISQLKEFGENALGLNTQVWILNQGENENNILQSAQKIAGGLIYQNKGWLVDLEAYYNQTDGLSTLGPSFGSSSASTEIDFFSTGSATARGIDLLMQKRWRTYQTWLNYSFSRINFNFPELLETSFTATHEQQHNLSWTNSYTYKKWAISLSYQYKTGLPFTDGIAVGEDIDFEDLERTGNIAESTFYFVEYGEPNAQRLPNYSRLDAGISYRPTFKKTALRAELTFSIINLLNRTNTFQRNFFLDNLAEEEDEFSQPQLFGTDKRLLRRTPLLVARIYW
ncbi:MAG: carboxypeptidase-like regulatory domain-containing protein [Bacteroidota bacterium]